MSTQLFLVTPITQKDTLKTSDQEGHAESGEGKGVRAWRQREESDEVRCQS
jgi:hypothetical protein